MSDIKLSPKQDEVFCDAMEFLFNETSKFYVLSGVAGSGKTEIIKKIIEATAESHAVGCGAYTGRAASVIANKLKGARVTPQTIHSMIYVPVVDTVSKQIIRFDRKERLDFDFLIIDEASMVPEDVFNDLYAYNIPILFVGDKEQLPPPSQTKFNIMEAADVHLDEIHRQAEGNPIIQLSREIRETGTINKNRYSDVDEIQFLNRYDLTVDYLRNNPTDVILTGTNNRRQIFNRLVRTAKGYHDEFVEPNEIVICLQNTHIGLDRIYNGERFRVLEVFPHDSENHKVTIQSIDTDSKEKQWVVVNKKCWEEDHETIKNRDVSIPNEAKLAYGEAISVWKSQGSQFSDVILYDEDVSYFVDRRKFRYTAVTRAVDTLRIVQ